MSLRNKIESAAVYAFEEAKKIEGATVEVKYYFSSVGIYDPVTEINTVESTSKTITAVKESANKRQIVSGLAEIGDIFLTILGKDLGTAPSMTDHVEINGKRYGIEFIDDDSLGVIYSIQVRA